MNKISIKITAEITMPDGEIRTVSTSVSSPEMSETMLKDVGRVEHLCEKTLEVACSHVRDESLHVGNQKWNGANKFQTDLFGSALING